jgi:tetratricopeptide (TPR) repeat protein
MSVQDAALFHQALRAYNANNLMQARMLCEEMLQRSRSSAEALDLMGRIAFSYGHLDEAKAWMKKCAALRPKDPIVQIFLGQIYSTEGQQRQALSSYDRALRLDPNNSRAVAGKAEVLEHKGERDKSFALLEPWINSGKASPEIAVIQARLALHDRRFDDLLAALEPAREQAAGHTLRHMYFLTGKALEGKGEYDAAFDAYQSANAVVPSNFNTEAWTSHSDQLIEAFSSELLAKAPRATHRSELPIFIVGMPRSGSTLVESIIDAHPDAGAVGELSAFQQLVNGCSLHIGSTSLYPQCVADLESADVESLSAQYLEQLHKAGGRRATRLVDKYLINYRHLGLIALLFPQARILHTVRDPLDTCVSCYMESLHPVPHPYAADLADLGRVYRDYERLMNHWTTVLDLQIETISYEALVADQESISRELITFCGLDFNEACLRYYESGRTVTTLSYDQVNRPVYRTSVERAKRFHKHLEPLRSALAEHAADPNEP